MNTIQLGQEGRDVITGFSGVVMAKCQYLTGCNQIMLTPTKLTKEGKRQDAEWFDESRIEAVGKKIVKLIGVEQSPGSDECSAPTK